MRGFTQHMQYSTKRERTQMCLSATWKLTAEDERLPSGHEGVISLLEEGGASIRAFGPIGIGVRQRRLGP